MSKLRLTITMSLDGYVAGPQQSPADPVGRGGLELHQWMFPLREFRERHSGEAGGEVNQSSEVLRERWENIGATIMGRHMFGGGSWPWGEQPWQGWWGEEPPYHHPVFVLTQFAREPLVKQGGSTFHFVTDGIEAALDQAREAAGGADVCLAGGAAAANQYLAAGLVEELDLSIAPVLLGSGERLFEGVGEESLRQELVRVVHAPGVTHVKYRVDRAGAGA